MSNGYSRTDFSESCEENKAYLYIINCYNDNENFFKIGITKHLDLKKRFIGESNSVMPYKYKIIKQVQSSPSIIYDLETKLHQVCKEYEYRPLISFGGEFECFTDIQNAILFLDELTTWLSNIIQIQQVAKKLKIPQIPLKILCEKIDEYQTQIVEAQNRGDEPLYQDLVDEYNALLILHPQIKEWIDSGMGTERFKALSYTKEKIQQEYARRTILRNNEDLISKYLKFEVGGVYSREEIVERLTVMYNDLCIEKIIKATDIQDWFSIKATTSSNNPSGKAVLSYKILGRVK